MKKRLSIVAIIIILTIAVVAYLSQPKPIISDRSSYDIYRVVYNGVDVTQQVDCEELASIVSKYTCRRFPHPFAPYQLSQVVVELNGISGNNGLHILAGDINVAYESGNSGFSINNSDELLGKLLDIMPHLTKEARGLEEETVITFSDGESADLWRSVYGGRDNIYKLSDETTLLTIETTSGPDDVYVAGVESFDDLSESAQKAVSSYYEEQGLLYNTRAELEKAYAEYLTCKASGTEYHEHYISQDITPTASNHNIMYFLTSVMLPANGDTVQEIRLGAAFEQETGEILNTWDLFAIPEEEARQCLLDKCASYNPALRAEMEAALKPEYIILFPENLTVNFPEGTLASQEYSYCIGLDYNELRAILQPWAIPNASLS